ncbi:MAG: epoxyqueuosine reductase [Oscillospiraceae bacterium]|nr:epoxyqueuosine reductase [Oscillospiraceae bacterium]
MEALYRELEALLKSKGAALVGAGDIKGLPGAGEWPVGVAVALPLPPALVAEIAAGPTAAYADVYDQWNARLDEMVTAGAEFLQGRGFAARAQSLAAVKKDENYTTPLPHKTVATRAGLGWVGKNCLLVTPGYGPAVRISSLLTNAPLPTAAPVEQSRCGGCTACQTACPGGAITGTLWQPGLARPALLNWQACQGAMEKLSRPAGLGHDLCGRCFVVCPYTKQYLNREGAR